MATLSSAGLGSGLDINGMISKLMSVEQQPLTVLTKQETSYTAKLSAYGMVKGALSSFQTAAKSLTSLSAFNIRSASVADSSVMTVSASARAAEGSYSLEVTQLAQSQKLRTSSTFAATNSALGSVGDTLTFDFGTYAGGSFEQNPAKGTKTVTLASGQNTLSGVRDAINAANIGVGATLINDGAGYRLMLTSKDTGSANALRVTASAGLSAVTYDATGAGTSNMGQTQAALNATFNLDGVAISQSSNTITNALEGLSMTLTKTNVGSPTTLTVANDATSLRAVVDSFVKAYNDASKTLKELTAYDAATKKGSVLQGDATALSIKSQIRSTLNTALSYTTGGIRTLSDAGISFAKDGTLSVDYTKFANALADSSKSMSSLFAAVGKPTDAQIAFNASTSESVPGNYGVRINQIATQGVGTGSTVIGQTQLIDGTNNALTVSVDGVPVSITLPNGSYSNAGLLSTLQAAINGHSSITSAGSAVTASMNGTQGTASGTSTATLVIDNTNKTFDVTVDGTLATITLGTGTYTADSLASEVQAKINADAGLAAAGKSVTVSQVNGVFTAKSNRYGASSDLSFAAGNGTAALFGVSNATVVSGTGTGTSTITLTSNRYGSASNINISGGTGSTVLFGGSVTGTAGKDVTGSIFNLSGLTQGKAANSFILGGANVVTGGVNDSLTLAVDGTSASITLAAGSYTAAQLASELQSKINADGGLAAAGKSVTVSVASDGTLLMTSDNYGTASSVTVTSGNFATTYLGTTTSTAGAGTITGLTQGGSTGSVALTAANIVTGGSNDTLNVSVDGTAVTVTLAAGSYTAAQLASHIQTQINAHATLLAAGKSVTASVDTNNYLVLTSNAYGTSSTVSGTGGNAATAFIGTATTTTGTGTAAGSGKILTGTTGDGMGIALEISGGNLGARGTLAFDKGFATKLDTLIGNMLSSAGTLSARTEGINKSIADIAKRREVINKRLTDIEARYRKQFNALDTLVASMQQTSQYLSQQLANLPSTK